MAAMFRDYPVRVERAGTRATRRHRLEREDQSLGAVAPVTLRLQRDVELACEREPRHRELHDARPRRARSPCPSRSGRRRSRARSRRRRCAARGSTAPSSPRHRSTPTASTVFDVEACALRVEQGFAHRDDVARHERLVHELGVLAGAGPHLGAPPSSPSRRSTGARRRTCPAPTDHDRQRAVAGADVAARDRRVERVHAAVRRPPSRPRGASDGRLDVMSTTTDPGARCRDHAVVAEQHLSTSVGYPTIVNTMSLCAATAAGVSAQAAPRSTQRLGLGPRAAS